jgi:hypothetical protein
MKKKYEYGGLIYCEDDLSEEIDNYGGSLFDLYWNLKEAGMVDEITYYYKRYAYDNCEFYKEYEKAKFYKEAKEKLEHENKC